MFTLPMVILTCGYVYLFFEIAANHAGFLHKLLIENVLGMENGILHASKQASNLNTVFESDCLEDSKIMHFEEIQKMDLRGFAEVDN